MAFYFGEKRELFVLKILRNVRERKVLYVSMSKDKNYLPLTVISTKKNLWQI